MKILTLAEVAKLTSAAATKLIVDTLATEQRAFIVVAKLARHVETKLAEGETLGAVLRKKGVRKGTIDNARYAMRIIDEFVEPGILTEKQFDTFGFRDCFRISRVMSTGSKMTLSPSDVALVMKESPKDWDEELDCIYEHGMTVDQKAEADKAAAAPPAPAEPAAPAGPETPAAAPTPSPAPANPATPTAENPDAPAPEESKIVDFPAAPTTPDTARGLIDKLEAVLCELPADELLAMKDDLLKFAATISGLFAEKAEPKKAGKKVKAA